MGWLNDPQTLRIPKNMLQASEPLQMFQVHSSNPGCLIELPDDFDSTESSTIVDLCFGHDRSPDAREHTVLRFVRRGGRLDALWQHMDMLDLLS